MVADLITAFHEAQLNLAKEIENPDSERFRLLDSQVEQKFSAIVDYTPTTATEFHTLSTFLLDMLARNDQGSNSRIFSRLADLFQVLVDRI
jgi:hypothetical protein